MLQSRDSSNLAKADEIVKYLARKEGLEKLAVTSMVQGKRSRGKLRPKYTDKLRDGLEIGL